MNTLDIGKIIFEKREARGWTQEQLAEKVGVSTKTISSWENGKGESIKFSNLKKLEEVFEVSIVYLLTGEEISGMSEEGRQRLEQAIKEMGERIDDVRDITIKVEGQGLLSIEIGFYAFGLALSAFFLAWWAATDKTAVISIVCFAMVVFGFLFMFLGKRAIQKLEKKRQSDRDLR